MRMHFATITLIGLLGVGGIAHAAEAGAPEKAPVIGLLLWLRADSLTNADATAVEQWSDSSGHEFHAMQKSTDWKPTFHANALNGKPVVRFDGKDDWLGITANMPETNYTYAVVFRTRNADASGAFLTAVSAVHYQNTAYDRVFGLTAGKLTHKVWRAGIGLDTTTGPATSNDNQAHIALVTVNNDGIKLYVDGTLVVTGSRTQSEAFGDIGLVVGGEYYEGMLDGDLAEVLVCDHALTTEERDTVVTYLKTKYIPTPPVTAPTAGK